jgi:hypothetical protein
MESLDDRLRVPCRDSEGNASDAVRETRLITIRRQ